MIDFKKSFFLFKKPANAQQAAYFVKAEKPLYERTPLPDQHPRRPRGSKSGRVRRRDESFQAWAEEPLGTDSHRTNSKRSRECWFLIGHKKCFVLLCPIGKQHLLSSFREFVHDGCYLATVARFVHQAFLTRNEGTTDESKIVSDSQQDGNAICLIVWPTIQYICPRTQAAFNSLPNRIAGWA